MEKPFARAQRIGALKKNFFVDEKDSSPNSFMRWTLHGNLTYIQETFPEIDAENWDAE